MLSQNYFSLLTIKGDICRHLKSRPVKIRGVDMLSLMKQVPPKLFTSLHGCLLFSTKVLEHLGSCFLTLPTAK